MYDINPNIIPSYKLFAGPLTEKNLNAIYGVGTATSDAIVNYENPAKTVGYKENVPIAIYTLDPPGSMEGDSIMWKCEAELRRVVDTNPGGVFGVKRRFTKMRQGVLPWGGFNVYQAIYDLEYYRVNPAYAPTYPSFSFGVAFTYQGDHVSGGVEGTWTLTQGSGSTCTQTISSDKKLVLTQTVFSADSYTYNATNLGLSTVAYPKLRVRFKTTGNATARVDATFSSGSQTVMAEASSATFLTVECALTTSKTLDHINLYCCDGTGTVTYDFVQIYSGTYIIPVVTKLDPPFILNDAISEMPSRSGSSTQGLGSKSVEVNMEVDLDMETASFTGSTQTGGLTWKRPQSSTSKTDANNQDVFMEQLHLGGINQAFTWLKLGNPAMQFKARLEQVSPSYSGESGKIMLTWREYRNGSAINETTVERFGLNL